MKSTRHEFSGCDVHDAMAKGEPLGDAIEAIRRMERAQMERIGWYAHLVQRDPESPTGFNCHTHGFSESFGHPDFQVVLPVPSEDAHQMLNNLYVLVKEGRRFRPGDVSDLILDGGDVAFAEAVENGRPVLRMILPDVQGKVKRGEIGEPYSIQYEGTTP